MLPSNNSLIKFDFDSIKCQPKIKLHYLPAAFFLNSVAKWESAENCIYIPERTTEKINNGTHYGGTCGRFFFKINVFGLGLWFKGSKASVEIVSTKQAGFTINITCRYYTTENR